MVMLSRSIKWGEGWVWPVPDMNSSDGFFPAVVSQEFRPRGSPRPHLGVDIMYVVDSRAPAADRWFVSEGAPVVAARDGTVWSTGHTQRGWNVVLDHGPPWATFYQHLQSAPLVKAGDRVRAGQPLGVVGVDPTDAQGLRHLHFAAWYKGHGDPASVNPWPSMAGWRRVAWTRP